MTFPTLYHRGKHGSLCQWRVWSEGDSIYTEFGIVGGKLQTSTKKATPKNVGRANATTSSEQAAAEAQSMFDFKLTRKYSRTPEQAKQPLFLPMLAQSFDKRKSKVRYPVDVQPKLDGLRAMASWDDERKQVLLLSRAWQYYKIPHTQKQLEQNLPSDAVADGEIYIHGMPFQQITSLAKRNRADSEQLMYYVYDMPCWGDRDDEPWSARQENLDTWGREIRNRCTSVRIVTTLVAESAKAVQEYQQYFVENGFEGAIVRLPDGRYEFGYRSYSLLKVKSFDDAEFKVLSAAPGKGKFEDMAIFTCAIDGTGKTFDVVPRGTAQMRRDYLKNAKQYIGQKLTVRYFGTSEDGIPRFPVGVGFRPEEDQP